MKNDYMGSVNTMYIYSISRQLEILQALDEFLAGPLMNRAWEGGRVTDSR